MVVVCDDHWLLFLSVAHSQLVVLGAKEQQILPTFGYIRYCCVHLTESRGWTGVFYALSAAAVGEALDCSCKLYQLWPSSSSESPLPVHRRWENCRRSWCSPGAHPSCPEWPVFLGSTPQDIQETSHVDLHLLCIGCCDVTGDPKPYAILGRLAGHVLAKSTPASERDELPIHRDILAWVE